MWCTVVSSISSFCAWQDGFRATGTRRAAPNDVSCGLSARRVCWMTKHCWRSTASSEQEGRLSLKLHQDTCQPSHIRAHFASSATHLKACARSAIPLIQPPVLRLATLLQAPAGPDCANGAGGGRPYGHRLSGPSGVCSQGSGTGRHSGPPTAPGWWALFVA